MKTEVQWGGEEIGRVFKNSQLVRNLSRLKWRGMEGK